MPAPKTRERLAVRVEALTKRGYSAAEIAEKLGVSDRTVKRYRAESKRDGTGFVYEVPEPKPDEALHPDIQALRRFHPDAFERFFNRYSGRILAPHSRKFVEMALGQEQVLINVPPRHAKSTIFSVWLPIWLIARSRDVQILLLSKTQSLALKFLREIAYHLEHNQQLVQDFGRFRPDNGTGAMWSPATGYLEVAGRDKHNLSGDLTVIARGAMQQVYGFSANWIVADDVVDIENTLTVERREKLSDWFHTEVLTRLEPDGRAVVVGTRFHLDDLYGELASKRVDDDEDSPPLWMHVNFPAVTNWDTGEVLWPERWPIENLRKIYNKIGAARFQQSFQQDPVPADERLVDPDWIYGSEEKGHPGCLDTLRTVGHGTAGKDWVRVVSLDPSPSRYASMIVSDVKADPEKFHCVVIEVVRRKMGVREMLSELTRIGAEYHPSYMIAEVNAAQKWLLQDQEFKLWSQANDIRVIPHTTGRNKSDPDYGVKSLATDFEFGRIRLPWGDHSSRENVKILIEEATTHPYGATDDVLMALWFMRCNFHRLVPRVHTTGPSRGFRVPPRLIKRGFRGLRKTA